MKNIITAKFNRGNITSKQTTLFDSLDIERQKIILNIAGIHENDCFIVQWINDDIWMLIAQDFIINYANEVSSIIKYSSIKSVEPIIDIDSINKSQKLEKVHAIEIEYNNNKKHLIQFEKGSIGTILGILRFIIQHKNSG